jgi:hypothetical protein
MLVLNKYIIKLLTSDIPISPWITETKKYKTYFADCVNVLDRTYINVWASFAEQLRYWNRKGYLS